MPRYDFKCQSETCGHIFEGYVSLADFPKTLDCVDCGGSTVKVHLPKSVRWTPEPVIVYKAPDGTYRFPGDGNGLSAKNYEKAGFDRVEIRGAMEMRKFEARMNKSEYAKAQRQYEHRQEQRERREKESRSELRRQMQTMSEYGKAVARAAMAHGDAKPVKRPGESGFVSEVYSYDRGSRDESRDAQGRRRRD